MYITASNPFHKKAKVFCLISGIELTDILWADDQTNEYEYFVKDEQGKIQIDPQNPNRFLSKRAKSPIRIELTKCEPPELKLVVNKG